jgi:hypothetical protein
MRPNIAAMNAAHLPPLILSMPAMGVPASFYDRFADALGAVTGAVSTPRTTRCRLSRAASD